MAGSLVATVGTEPSVNCSRIGPLVSSARGHIRQSDGLRRTTAPSVKRPQGERDKIGHVTRSLETRYANADGLSIAYQVSGEGPIDVVLVPGLVSHLEISREAPGPAHAYQRYESFARLIRFDKRGTGLSDRVSGSPTLEERMDDVRAVMDAAGS
jgi:hypothetical protein